VEFRDVLHALVDRVRWPDEDAADAHAAVDVEYPAPEPPPAAPTAEEEKASNAAEIADLKARLAALELPAPQVDPAPVPEGDGL
jgi:hypothetical protein